MSGLRRFQ